MADVGTGGSKKGLGGFVQLQSAGDVYNRRRLRPNSSGKLSICSTLTTV